MLSCGQPFGKTAFVRGRVSESGCKIVIRRSMADENRRSRRKGEGRKEEIDLNRNDAEDRSLAWEEIRREHLIHDQWIDFRRSAYRYPDGRVFEPFYTYSKKDYSVVVARTEEGKYLCVRQFRQGLREVTTEFPAGGIEHGEGERPGPAEALAAAKRELREETGYASDRWTHLLTVPSHATLSDNYAHLFLAEDCRPVSGQQLDETEVLKVIQLSGEEIESLIASGGFQQAVHILAWLLYLRIRRSQSREE